MAWVVDTCLVLDVLEDDSQFALPTATFLARHLEEGLVLCPVTYVELAPAFLGSRDLQDEFLTRAGIHALAGWTQDDTRAAHSAWNRYVVRKRRAVVSKRPIADLLIGAFALRHQGLLTRNASDFRLDFPDLELRSPLIEAGTA